MKKNKSSDYYYNDAELEAKELKRERRNRVINAVATIIVVTALLVISCLNFFSAGI